MALIRKRLQTLLKLYGYSTIAVRVYALVRARVVEAVPLGSLVSGFGDADEKMSDRRLWIIIFGL